MRKVRPAINAEMEVELRCPRGHVVTLDGNMAYCPLCGAFVCTEDLSVGLDRCSASLQRLIESISARPRGPGT